MNIDGARILVTGGAGLIGSTTIDLLLRHDPGMQGESREGDRRILIVLPLCVVFRVLEEDRRAEVVHVWNS